MWVYRINGDTEVYEVGYYAPYNDGAYEYVVYEFVLVKDYASEVDAAQRVHFLNGGN